MESLARSWCYHVWRVSRFSPLPRLFSTPMAHPKRSTPPIAVPEPGPARRAARPVPRVEAALDTTDAELVSRARQGDRWAQEAIFRRYVRDVTLLCEHLLRRRQDANDVTQDTFASALSSLDSLRDPAALRSWLLGIAVNRVRRRDRWSAWLRLLGLDRGFDDASLPMVASRDLSPEGHAELALVQNALSTLSAGVRAAWILRHVEGEKLDDVAAILGCSLATAKRRIAAADARVQRHVEGRAR